MTTSEDVKLGGYVACSTRGRALRSSPLVVSVATGEVRRCCCRARGTTWSASSKPHAVRTASNVALEPVECRVFTADDLREFLVEHPAAALELLRLTIRKVRAGDRRRADATGLDVSHRLAHFLVERAEAQRQPDLDIALTQQELASLIASSRDSVVRALTALRTRGLIETGRRQITIRDMEGLRQYAG